MLSKNDLKFIKSLKLKKNRSCAQQYVVEGRKSVEEVLKADVPISKLIGTAVFKANLEEKGLLRSLDFTVTDQRTLESASSFQSNNSGLAVLPIPSWERPPQKGVHIVLDGVRDPGNLGTIVRSLDWFGFNTLICSPDCADFYNPKALAATMGSFARLQPVYLDLKQYLTDYQHLPTYGMVLGGNPIESKALPMDGIYMMGSESHGISDDLLPGIDHQVAISPFGQAESLNVAMATSILLFAIRSGYVS